MTGIIHIVDDSTTTDACCDSTHIPRSALKAPDFGFLFNDEEWMTKDGRVLKLEDMTSTHRENVIRLLERLEPRDVVWHFFSSIWAHPIWSPRGDMAQYTLEREEELALENPDRWLRNTPLMKKLYELNRGF